MQTTHGNKNNTLHPIIYKLFQKKGLTNSDISEFFSWNLRDLPDFLTLKDIEKTSERIIQAIDNKEKIAIFGDYDVDGTTSCALFYHFFKLINVDVAVFQPSRFIEGYGLHNSSIDNAKEQNVNVLITVDCGITNNEAADYAKECGIDLIITDHHNDARDEMPGAYAVVNPNRRDEVEAEMKSLAGVGVAFAVCWKIKSDLDKRGAPCPSIYPLLQFVAIGTICDLAKLNMMNIKLVRHGLKQIPNTDYPGIKSFFPPKERELGFVPSEKISFGVGPLINSKGRLDHAEMALKLLTSNDSTDAYNYYSHLEICNKERKQIQKEVFDKAKAQVEKKGSQLINIVYGEDWHEGVIGIVASKLVESFKVPSIVFTNGKDTGVIKASARSAGELDIFKCLKDNSDLFLKFGGHKAAAGLSMNKDNLYTFTERINRQLSEVPEIERTVQSFYDLEINPEDISPKLVRDLEQLEPFGMGNPKPIFKMKNIKLESFDLLKDVHVRWNLIDKKTERFRLKGISFNYIGKWGVQHPNEIVREQMYNDLTAYFTLGINRFNGREYIQLMIEKITTDDF